MKTLIAILLASVLSLAAFAQSQDQTSGQGSQATQGSQSQTDTKASSGKSMSGTVSHDGFQEILLKASEIYRKKRT